jgi:hypothetical protein
MTDIFSILKSDHDLHREMFARELGAKFDQREPAELEVAEASDNGNEKE